VGNYIAWSPCPARLNIAESYTLAGCPGDRGTEISIALSTKFRRDEVARGLASVVGWDPEQLVRAKARVNLKQLLEAGELPTTTGNRLATAAERGWAALRVLYREGTADDAMSKPARRRLAVVYPG